MRTSETIDKLIESLALAQGEFKEAEKDGKSHHAKYSTLTSIWAVAKEPLSKNGLAILQAPCFEDGRVRILTRLCHKSGQWIETELSIKPEMDNAQKIGSAITYGRRYALAPLLGIVNDEDDDGNAAVGKDVKTGKKLDDNSNGATFAQKPKPYMPSIPVPTIETFDKAKPEHLDRLEKYLIGKNIAQDCYDDIAVAMHDKPMTARFLDEAIKKVTEKE